MPKMYKVINDATHQCPYRDKNKRGYRALEYLESTGTQCIETTYHPGPNTRWVLNFQFTQLTKDRWVAGAGMWGVDGYCVGIGPYGSPGIDVVHGSSIHSMGVAAEIGTTYSMDINLPNVYINGVKATGTGSGRSTVNASPLQFFAS